MAGSPGGRSVGRVSVRVVPDTSRFAKELKAQLAKVDEDFAIDIGIDTAKASAQFKAFKQRIERDTIEAKVTLDRSLLDRMTSALTNIGKSSFGASGNFSALNRSVLNVLGTLGKGVAILAVIGPLIAILVGLAYSLAGALTAAFAGLPAMLAAIAGPIAAVILGFDGIAKAAKVLQPQLDSLRSTLSATFERGMTPIFTELQAVFPVIEEGLNNVAEGAIRFAEGMVSVVTSQQGLDNLRGSFAGMEVFLERLQGGVSSLLEELLNIAGMEQLYRSFGDLLGNMAEGVAGFLENLRIEGEITTGLINLQVLFEGISDLLGAIAKSSLEFFNGSATGISDFLSAVGETIDKIDWEALGKSFGDMFTKIAEGLRDVDPTTLETIVVLFEDFGKAVEDFVESGGIDVVMFLIAGLIASFKILTDTITTISNTFRFLGFIFQVVSWKIKNEVDQTIAGWENLKKNARRIFSFIGELIEMKVNEIKEDFERIGKLPDRVAKFFTRMYNLVTDRVDDIVDTISDFPGRAREAIGDLSSTLWASGRSLVGGFIDGIQSKIDAAAAAAKAVVTAARRYFPFSPAREGPFSGTGYTSYSGQALIEDWAKGIRDGTATAVKAVDEVMNATNTAATTQWQGHISSDSFGGMTGAVTNGVMAAFNGSRLTVDGNGMARVVNDVNAKNINRR